MKHVVINCLFLLFGFGLGAFVAKSTIKPFGVSSNVNDSTDMRDVTHIHKGCDESIVKGNLKLIKENFKIAKVNSENITMISKILENMVKCGSK